MKCTCPSCGAEMDLDVLLAHEHSRQALAMLIAAGMPLGKALLQYLRLFKPAKRQLGMGRVATLLEPLLADLQRGQIERGGRLWAAPREAWATAIDKLLEARDAGKLTLPLKSHGYLYEVIAGQADKVEAQAERDIELQRRAREHVAGPAKLQPGAAVSAAAAVHVPDPQVRERLQKARASLQARGLALPLPQPPEGGEAP